MKENDYFLNVISNPTFTPEDFMNVGLDPTNTSLERKDVYNNIDLIKLNKIFLTNGSFDLSKFDNLYNQALNGYRTMSSSATNKNLGNNKVFSKYNIFAPQALKEDSNTPTYKILFIGNPHRQASSFKLFGATEAPEKSDREIALTKKVWNNATNTWEDTAESSFFDNIFNPKVLALYDEDVKDKDGNIIHQKGEKKINPITGTYYYEDLNGRDIYGREVLSAFDTITKEDSALNKFDFFDSDDVNKSFGGTLMKDALKVIPAFIPGVAPWYVGARVGIEFTDLFAKLGKMVPGIGSNSPFLSRLEGMSQAMNFSNSDNALLHAWSMENILNLSADVFTLLAEQRWLFEYAPSLMKRSKLGFDKEALKAFKDLKFKELYELGLGGMLKDGSLNTMNAEEKLKSLLGIANIQANLALENQMSEYGKLGEYLSKAYMTGITVADSYGEAKLAGYDDLSAALFTLGYGLGEYGILNTLLGEMILPELRLEKARYKNIIKKALGDTSKLEKALEIVENSGDKKAKMNFISNLLSKGRNAAKEYWSGALDEQRATGEIFAKHLVANSLGEGVEEVSEELLADFAKTISNGIANFIGSDKKLNAFDRDEEGNILWGQLISRYGLNFIGGVIGGSLGQGLTGDVFKQAAEMNSMDQKTAYLNLVHLVANKKGSKLKKIAHEMVLGNLYLGIGNSASDFVPTTTTTQDELIKGHFDNLIDNVETILKVNNADIDDKSFLKHLALEDLTKVLKLLKELNLSDSDTMSSYLLDWNDTLTDIVKLSREISDIENPKSETDKLSRQELSEEEKLQLNKKKLLLKLAIEKKDAYLDGTMSKEAVPLAFWEMSDAISSIYADPNFISYAERIELKPLNLVSETRILQLKDEWSNLKESGTKRDNLRLAFLTFMFNNQRVSDAIKGHDAKYYEDNPDTFVKDLTEALLVGPKSISYLNFSKSLLEDSEGYFDLNGITSELSKDLLTVSLLMSKLLGKVSKEFLLEHALNLKMALELPKTVKDFLLLANKDIYKTFIGEKLGLKIFDTRDGVYLDVSDIASKKILQRYDFSDDLLELIDSSFINTINSELTNLKNTFTKIKELENSLEGEDKSIEQKQEICNQINKLFPDYGAIIDEEGNYHKTSLITEDIIPENYEEFQNLSVETLKTLLDLIIQNNYNNVTDADLNRWNKVFVSQTIKNFLINTDKLILDFIKESKYMKHSIKEHLKSFFKKYYLFLDIDAKSISAEEPEGEDDIDESQLSEDDLLQFWWELALYITSFENSVIDRDTFKDNLNYAIDLLLNSPVEDLIDLFQVSLKLGNEKVSNILKLCVQNILNGLLNKDLSLFNLDSDLYQSIKNALLVILLVKAHILAARVDGVDADNILGFNYVVNQLNSDFDLALIEKNTSNSILNDLNKIYVELNYYKNLYENNSGQKVTEANLVSALFKLKKFKKLKYIVSIIPDDWEGKGELENAFLNTTIDTIEDYNLNDDNYTLVTKELVNAELAIHKFFNLEKVIEYLKDPNKRKELFNSKNFKNLLEPVNDAVKLGMSDISDSSTIHYLATLTALNPKEFYNEFNLVLNEKYLPLEALITAILEAYAFKLNGSVFDLFDSIYNDLVTDLISKLDKKAIDKAYDEHGSILPKDNGLSTSAHILFNRHFFIEGVAGSGKSTAVYTYLNALLTKFHPDLTKKVWFVHKTKALAELAAKEAGFNVKLTECFSFDEYLKKINPDYVPIISRDGKKDTSVKLLEDSDTKLAKYQLDINTLETPSLVIIDEATNLSLLDLLLSNDFLSAIKSRAICTGDYNLSSLTYTEKEDLGNGLVHITNYDTTLNNFPHGIKIGTSMRSLNLIKDLNISTVETSSDKIIKAFLNNEPKVTLSLGYTEILDGNDKGLYGDKFILSREITPEIEASIKLMLDSVEIKKDGTIEPINFIHGTNIKNPLYEYLLSLNDAGEYKGRIKFIDSSTALGLEGKYYIIDSNILDFNNLKRDNVQAHDIKKVIRDFYTFISRAKLGSLFIGQSMTINDGQLESIVYINNNNVKEILKLPITDELKHTLYERAKNSFTQALQGEKFSGTKYIGEGEVNKEVPELKHTYNEDDPNRNNSEALQQLNKSGDRVFTPELNDKKEAISCPMLIHSFLSNESGLIIEPDGSIHVSEDFDNTSDEKPDGRIDNLNGLIHYGIIPINTTNKTISLENYESGLNLLANLKNTIINATDKSALEKNISDKLGLTGNCKIKFIYRTTSHNASIDSSGKNNWLKKLFKSVREKLWGISEGLNDSTQNKEFSAVIIDSKGKPILDISLFNFTSPLTLMKCKGYEKVLAAYRLWEASLGEKRYNFLDFADYLENNNIENGLLIAKLFRIYSINFASITEFSDDFLPATFFENIGPTTTVLERGTSKYYEVDGYEWPKVKDNISELGKLGKQTILLLMKPGRKISKVYMFAKRNESVQGIPVGCPFVLVCDDVKTDVSDIDSYLFDLYSKQLAGDTTDSLLPKVKLLLVTPPSVSVEEYINNFAKFITKNGEDADSSEGNDFTPYRILYAITRLNSNFRKYLKDLFLDKNLIALLNNGKPEEQFEVITKIIDYLHDKTPEERRDLLKIKSFDDHHIANLLNGSGIANRTDTILQTLRRALTLFGLKENFSGNLTINLDLINERVAIIKKDLADKDINDGVSIKEIFYDIPLKENSMISINNGVAYLLDVNNKYEYKEKPLYIKGKLDTATLYGDVTSILDEILRLAYDETLNYENMGKYVYGYNVKTNDSKAKLDKWRKLVLLTNESGLVSMFDLRSDWTEDSLMELLENNNYYVYKDNNELKIIPFKFPSEIISHTEINKNGLTYIEFKLSNNLTFRWDGNQITEFHENSDSPNINIQAIVNYMSSLFNLESIQDKDGERIDISIIMDIFKDLNTDQLMDFSNLTGENKNLILDSLNLVGYDTLLEYFEKGCNLNLDWILIRDLDDLVKKC